MNKYVVLVGCLLLVACGGGGGSSGPDPVVVVPPTPVPPPSEWVPGQYEPASNYENICANPRSNSEYQDTPGSVVDENFWIRSFSHDTYLWYRELADIDPNTVDGNLEYFALLKTDAVTPSGNPKDAFHFTYDTEEWKRLSQSGISAGYGMELAVLKSARPRSILVAFTEPNSPASENGISRGAELIEVDGALVESGDANILHAGLFPQALGEQHTFVIRDLGSSTPRTVTLVSSEITSVAVQNTKTLTVGNKRIGYMTFNDYLGESERLLREAVIQLASTSIDELVIDMRYNGGGYLDIAAELGYMVVGDASIGKVFQETVFNDKYTVYNPITGRLLAPTNFLSKASGFSVSEGTQLPTLNLPRVFVLTGGGTASASEAFINGLRGIDVEVVIVGQTTRGKPYGFYGIDNCGTTYFTIQFRGENAKGFGDYADGFIPSDTDDLFGANVRGCVVADDFSHALGDPLEARLAAAIGYIKDGSCPTAAVSTLKVGARSVLLPVVDADELTAPEVPGLILR